MMSIELNRNQSRDLFLRLLISHARNGVIDDMQTILYQGPPKSEGLEGLLALHQWFGTIDNESKDLVCRIIAESIDRAIFSALTIIDGVSGGYPISGQLSDFALYLQTYTDRSRHISNLADRSVRLNPISGLEDLHDLFIAEVKKIHGTQ